MPLFCLALLGTLGSEKFTGLKFGEFANLVKQANANLRFASVIIPNLQN